MALTMDRGVLKEVLMLTWGPEGEESQVEKVGGEWGGIFELRLWEMKVKKLKEITSVFFVKLGWVISQENGRDGAGGMEPGIWEEEFQPEGLQCIMEGSRCNREGPQYTWKAQGWGEEWISFIGTHLQGFVVRSSNVETERWDCRIRSKLWFKEQWKDR